MPRVTVNRTELYYEIRGAGPPLLLIMGATGDGGHFDELAEVLADEFTPTPPAELTGERAAAAVAPPRVRDPLGGSSEPRGVQRMRDQGRTATSHRCGYGAARKSG